MNALKKFWQFLQEDNWLSQVVTLLLLVVVIKFVFFPILSFITGSPLPLVVVESCSMYHPNSFEDWWKQNSRWYLENDVGFSEFESFPNRNGLNKGDIIFVWGRTSYNVGDIIIFLPNVDSSAPHPIIHRIVGENPIETKGDNNPGQLVSGRTSNPQNIDETNIPEERILGKASVRIPALGWIKLIFFEVWKEVKEVTGIESRALGDRWFC